MKKVPSRKVEDADVDVDFTKTINLEPEEAIVPKKPFRTFPLSHLPDPKKQATAISLENIRVRK